jgi:hypothetical protein
VTRRTKAKDKVSVDKALYDSSVVTPTSREIGQLGLRLTRSFFDDLGEKELAPDCVNYTFDEMCRDPCIKHPLRAVQTNLNLSLAKAEFKPGKGRKGKQIADWANWLIHNMDGMTWLEAVRNFNSDVERGYSISEIVTVKETKGKYAGSWKIAKLGPRSQSSIYAWVWDEMERNVTHVVQRPLTSTNYLNRPSSGTSYVGNIVGLSSIRQSALTSQYPIISLNRCLHFKYDGVDNIPTGRSPLKTAYLPWREKIVIGKYQVIGITKDLGGTPVAYVPSDLIRNANDPDNRYPLDKAEYELFQQQLANLHAGKQSYFILPSDISEDSNTMREYEIELMGITGGGKQYDISEVIKQKTTEIYNAFGAAHLLLGQNGNTSSYNLSSSSTTIHGLLAESDILDKVSVIEHHLIPLMLDVNKISYTQQDLPTLVYKEPIKLSLDDAGKFIQRAKSVGGLTQEALEYIYELAELPIEGISELDFTGEDTSKAGTSKGSSGTGSSQAGGANSATNVENKQLEARDLILIDDYDDTSVYYDRTAKETVFINKVEG